MEENYEGKKDVWLPEFRASYRAGCSNKAIRGTMTLAGKHWRNNEDTRYERLGMAISEAALFEMSGVKKKI